MLKRVFSTGLLAGLVAGLALAILQHFITVPLILTAEVYETAAEAAATPAVHDHGAGDHHHDHAAQDQPKEWSPADGLERTLSTSVATIVTAIGFALILLAAMLLAGEEITPMRALAWAACGFAATGLATGLGLAPELPGSAGAALESRQIWWIATAFATALGLYLMFRATPLWARLGGLVLVLLPHAIGAPHAHNYVSTAPAELAAQFTASSLVVHAALWVIVGVSVGYFWMRMGSPAEMEASR
ncbi:CbtA family protein [Methyloferula stellata]|uniref:CbtA family protein n=1 Tax=Methyloferula stellata TaxID=876270 RepID=UPI000363C253|nr:CbtA family protein [Methyloferula stellata]